MLRTSGMTLLWLAAAVAVWAAGPPQIGVQVSLEPGVETTQEAADRLFQRLAEQQIPLARISLYTNYMERSDGTYDFSLYDRAFRAAQKHGVRLIPLLWPQAKNPVWSGVPQTDELLKDAENYLRQVVGHFKDHPAVDSYIIVGEPGQNAQFTPIAMKAFRAWLNKKYGVITALNKAWLRDAMLPQRAAYGSFEEIEEDGRWIKGGSLFWQVPRIDWLTFWRDHQSWYLKWVAEEVRKLDGRHPLHIYTHSLMGNLVGMSLDPPQWRGFVDSAGASAHPGGNFALVKRNEFPVAMSYFIDVIRGAMEPKPAWVTETQGGNNIHSGGGHCPTPKDLAQVVWTYVGGGAERIIFWLLNARQVSREMGEWGLLDFQFRPTDRLQTLGELSRVLKANTALFAEAKPYEPPVSIILSLEAMTLDEYHALLPGPGKDRLAHVRSALAFYSALHDLGVNPRLKFIHDFEWEKPSRQPQLVILPNLTATTAEQAAKIEAFVRRGNTVLLTGFTGFYDEYGMLWPMRRFPFQQMLGANFKEVRMIEREQDRKVVLRVPPLTLPAYNWIADIDNQSANVIGREGNRVTAIRNRAGAGEAIWIPSPIGWAAQLGDRRPLAELLRSVTAPFLGDVPFRFDGPQHECTMRVMRSGGRFITAITNGSLESNRCKLIARAGLEPHVLWGSASALSRDRTEVKLDGRETFVALWQ